MDRSHPARVYDYWLGGKDNFAADREMAERLIDAIPGAVASARANRVFLKQAVRFAVDSGVEQFIDIGSGLPTVENTHEIAIGADPKCRVVYVDNDPIVCVHGQALLASSGSTVVVQADLRRPEAIVNHPDVTGLIDFDRPLGLLLLGVLHFLPDDEAYAVMDRLRRTMVPGSVLAISHLTADSDPEGMARFAGVLASAPEPTVIVPRTRDHVERFFAGFDLVEPGLVAVHRWRPPIDRASDRFWLWAGVGIAR
ncbi:MAG TPA: SAM-dependent methyltransferase [Streptosporangiaceae bacterium]|nr:SAM-dependent methyltransferase [Streptosporangiaceae bacterium]